MRPHISTEKHYNEAYRHVHDSNSAEKGFNEAYKYVYERYFRQKKRYNEAYGCVRDCLFLLENVLTKLTDVSTNVNFDWKKVTTKLIDVFAIV